MSDTPDFSPEAIAEALNEATPGPWQAREGWNLMPPMRYEIAAPDVEEWSVVEAGDNDWGPAGGVNKKADAHLIANAPTWLAQLLAALEAKDGEVERLRDAQHERTEVFGECISDYERLRGYVAKRHGDMDADPRTVAHWMADNGGGLFVEGVPEADAWRDRFWPLSKPPEDDEPSESTQEYEHRYGKRADRTWYSDEDHKEAY